MQRFFGNAEPGVQGNFDSRGYRDHRDSDRTEDHRARHQNPIDRNCGKYDACGKNDNGNHRRCNGFGFAVAERVFAVTGLFGGDNPDGSAQGSQRVPETVDGVRKNRGASVRRADKQLGNAEGKVN